MHLKFSWTLIHNFNFKNKYFKEKQYFTHRTNYRTNVDIGSFSNNFTPLLKNVNESFQTDLKKTIQQLRVCDTAPFVLLHVVLSLGGFCH